TTLNTVSTIGSFLLGLSVLPFLYNVWKTAKYGAKVEQDYPCGWGSSLEWAPSSPPPRHTFTTLPRIRSESPPFDLQHPDIAARVALENTGRPAPHLADVQPEKYDRSLGLAQLRTAARSAAGWDRSRP
ncbi:hypothetical protein VM98_33960, partial [Streptomyces rubellomurinus subsp. indigoferus]